MKNNPQKEGGLGFGPAVLWTGLALIAFVACVSLGSVNISLRDVWNSVFGGEVSRETYRSIIWWTRLPRVLCAGLMGAALSLCGATMQGLLRNPLADGSTLGVSSGAALGAVLSIVLGITIPGLETAGPAAMAMLFAFGSLLLILALAWGIDRSFATHNIILIGVVFTMLVSALLSILITFSGEKLRSITYWTMGSLSGKSYEQAAVLLGGLILFGTPLFLQSRELNAFAVGEENALHVGVPVRQVKLTAMICASALIGICVSIGGSIAFVGLIIPHMVRLAAGPNHRRLLPLSAFAGTVFLMLADLAARSLLSPLELPIGVVTSLIGAVVFIAIFYRSRKGGIR
ncbi:MAG: iron ABC transporter permease [Clostridia bacterium]|nr:iron ABC transporter permease [Clostridia bacterium]